MDDFDGFAPFSMATSSRPLLGLTILAVEDSRFTSDALRQMCVHSGARIRRADCLHSAKRHLKVYRPSVAIIDLGLPDGSGINLIRDLDQATPRVSIILGFSGDDNAETAAMAAGADGFIAKPLTSLGAFQQAILNFIPEDSRPTGLRAVDDHEVAPDPRAYQDDMAHAASLLSGDTDGPLLDYVVQFLTGVATSARDTQLCAALSDLAKTRSDCAPIEGQRARLCTLVQARTQQQFAV